MQLDSFWEQRGCFSPKGVTVLSTLIDILHFYVTLNLQKHNKIKSTRFNYKHYSASVNCQLPQL